MCGDLFMLTIFYKWGKGKTLIFSKRVSVQLPAVSYQLPETSFKLLEFKKSGVGFQHSEALLLVFKTLLFLDPFS